MWGQVDVVSSALDMTLGVPATALKAAGVQDLPIDYMLTVPVKGTSQAPVVEWSKYLFSLLHHAKLKQPAKALCPRCIVGYMLLS